MDQQFAAGGNGPRQAVCGNISDELIGLCECYLEHPGDKAIEDQFFAACIKVLRKKIEYHVVYRCKGPKFLAPRTFADDVFNLALLKFWAGIRSLRSPAGLYAWLGRVASSSVYDELREFTRRRKEGPCEWETIETMPMSEDGNILDKEIQREFAERHEGSSAAPDLKQVVYRDILRKVFSGDEMDSKGKKRDWQILKLSTDLTVDEIAERFGTSKSGVRYRLKKSKHAFRVIARKRCKFTRSDI